MFNLFDEFKRRIIGTRVRVHVGSDSTDETTVVLLDTTPKPRMNTSGKDEPKFELEQTVMFVTPAGDQCIGVITARLFSSPPTYEIGELVEELGYIGGDVTWYNVPEANILSAVGIRGGKVYCIGGISSV